MATEAVAPALLITEALAPVACLILAHGAGAAMDTPFMTTIAEGVAAAGVTVVRFEFPYMAARRQGGSKRPPDRQPLLLATWEQVIDAVRQRLDPPCLLIGGKSMGGRMASLLADQQDSVAGVVALGFPFYAAGKPEKAAARVAHLATLQTPALFCQGTRDALGNQETIAGLTLSPAIQMHWLQDGDHSLKPRKSSGRTEAQALSEAASAIAAFSWLVAGVGSRELPLRGKP
jgi:predicted alpha/beta-hydrolase family hydrolase